MKIDKQIEQQRAAFIMQTGIEPNTLLISEYSYKEMLKQQGMQNCYDLKNVGKISDLNIIIDDKFDLSVAFIMKEDEENCCHSEDCKDVGIQTTEQPKETPASKEISKNEILSLIELYNLYRISQDRNDPVYVIAKGKVEALTRGFKRLVYNVERMDISIELVEVEFIKNEIKRLKQNK